MRRFTIQFAKLSLTLAIVVGLVWMVGWSELLSTLARMRWGWLFLGYVMFLGGRFLEAAQMRLILHKVGLYVSVTRIFLAHSLSGFYSLMLPSDLVAAMAKWHDLSRATGRKSLILNAMVYHRLALLLTTIFLGLLAILVQNPFPDSWLREVQEVLAVALLALAVGLYHPRLAGMIERYLRALTGCLPEWCTRRIEMMFVSQRQFQEFSTLDHVAVYAMCLLLSLWGAMIFICSAAAVGVSVSLFTAAWVVALLRVARQVPITISNIGVREAILIVVLAPFGVSADQALALGVITLSKQVLIGCIGGAYQVAIHWDRDRIQLKRPEEASRSTETTRL